jgi:hypothetical protein
MPNWDGSAPDLPSEQFDIRDERNLNAARRRATMPAQSYYGPGASRTTSQRIIANEPLTEPEWYVQEWEHAPSWHHTQTPSRSWQEQGWVHMPDREQTSSRTEQPQWATNSDWEQSVQWDNSDSIWSSNSASGWNV